MILTCETHGETEHVNFSWCDDPWRCKICLEELRIESEAGKKRLAEARSRNIKPFPQRPMPERIEAAQIPKEHRNYDATAENKRWVMAHKASWAACLLLGDVGTGKTAQACGMLRHGLFLGRSALYTTARRMSRWIIENNSVERFTGVHYLAIDEISRGFDTEAAEDRLFEVIDDRWSSGKPVILVGNVDADGLKDVIGPAAADRVRADLTMITMAGESLRKK